MPRKLSDMAPTPGKVQLVPSDQVRIPHTKASMLSQDTTGNVLGSQLSSFDTLIDLTIAVPADGAV